ncbi:probable membrane-associated kinase regulator 6 [Vicia villosa]|uniref:probable membrane-associated kinase regulator 6 n=1 Tax=Vicia villosa TaxID=3911 RepID=UPI00273ADAA4|nr:probable membrane-associated kinase regulator 6 [Vicia villosa]
MEATHPLSIESFSYSCLVNLKPSLDQRLDSFSSFRISIDASDELSSSFIEMDPRMPSSRRFFINSQDFKFDFPTSQQSSLTTLVDADQLFSNGYLMPLFDESLKNIEPYEYDTSNSTLPSSSSISHVPKKVVPIENSRSPSLKRCRTLSKRMIQKYLNFLKPLCRKLRSQKSGSSKHENGMKRTQSVKNVRGSYCESSPRISVAYSTDDWRMSCDSDSSIYDAVLHCKRSFERMS